MARNFKNASTEHITFTSFAGNFSAVTYAAWVNPTSFTIGINFAGVIASPSSPGLYLGLGKVLAYFSGSCTGATTLVAGNWYHIAATCITASGNATVYLNGVSDGTATALNANGIATTGYIGWDNSNNYFDGNIADAAYWSAALTPVEIKALYSGVRPGNIRPQSLVGWFQLDGYGAPALNRTNTGTNGVLTGTSFVTGPSLLNAAPIFPGVPAPAFFLGPVPPPFILMPQIVM